MNKIVWCGLCLITSDVYSAISDDRPNIIVIMADDMGWGDVGFNGNTMVKTPHLDALAANGVVLEHFYAGAPLSSPTRASVLTGRHPFRTGVFSANVGMLREKEVTLPELLKAGGYVTGMFGKWHLGTLTTTEKDANRGGSREKHLYNPPARHGFDESFVTESKVPTYDPMIQPVENDGRFWDFIREGEPNKPYGTYYWDTECVKVKDNLEGSDSRVIMDRVLPFVERSVAGNTPFLSVIWFHAPHLPCVAGPKYASLYEGLDKKQRNYFGCITALDEQVGRLVDCLKKKGVYENTIILFCSDNGPELETPGSPGQFRGKKRSLYEGGIRVPSLVSWPAKLQGSRISVPCCTVDYLPSLLDMANISYDKRIELDGESFWPKLTGEEFRRHKPLVFCSGNQGAVVDMEYKFYYCGGKSELYNIAQDPGEKNDISASNLDMMEKMRDYLRTKLGDFRRSFEDGKDETAYSWQQWKGIWNESDNK